MRRLRLKSLAIPWRILTPMRGYCSTIWSKDDLDRVIRVASVRALTVADLVRLSSRDISPRERPRWRRISPRAGRFHWF